MPSLFFTVIVIVCKTTSEHVQTLISMKKTEGVRHHWVIEFLSPRTPVKGKHGSTFWEAVFEMAAMQFPCNAPFFVVLIYLIVFQ